MEFTFLAGIDQRVVRAPIPVAKELLDRGLTGAALLRVLENQ